LISFPFFANRGIIPNEKWKNISFQNKTKQFHIIAELGKMQARKGRLLPLDARVNVVLNLFLYIYIYISLSLSLFVCAYYIYYFKRAEIGHTESVKYRF